MQQTAALAFRDLSRQLLAQVRVSRLPAPHPALIAVNDLLLPAGLSMDALHRVTERLEKVALDIKHRNSASVSASNMPPGRLDEVRQALCVMIAPYPEDPTLDDVLRAPANAPAEQAAPADFTW